MFIIHIVEHQDVDLVEVDWVMIKHKTKWKLHMEAADENGDADEWSDGDHSNDWEGRD